MAPTRVIRRRLMGSHEVRIEPPRPSRSLGSGASQMMIGFAIVLTIGVLLLWLPFSTTEREWAHLLEALFTAVSAICVTGLVVVETEAHWSGFGEVVILGLIQVGGLGYMLGTTVLLWALGRRLGLRDRHMLRLYYGAPNMRETLGFARGVAYFTFIVEGIGAAILYVAFLIHDVDPVRAIWWAIFHSVSAFNNAGFSVTGSDMTGFAEAPLVLLTISALVILGGLGFLPVITFLRRRSFARLPLDHKLIFVTTAALLVSGTLFLTLIEWGNGETLGSVDPVERPLVGFFEATNARTAGFSAVTVSEMEDESKLSVVGLMFVGGSAGSTAGGLKVATFSLLLAAMIATLRGRSDVSLFRREIPQAIIAQATTLALYFVALVFGFSIALTLVSDQEFIDLLFEAVSAIGTVGYSAADTPAFNTAGRIILIVAMIVGRFTPLLLVLHMTKPRRHLRFHHPEDSVRLG